ncbi:MAG TPA: hypothetical protein VGV09_12645 [Steroidobacteraceae bacterium]|nr:hypothetical protein [Steroidobacteraceae bacterium]
MVADEEAGDVAGCTAVVGGIRTWAIHATASAAAPADGWGGIALEAASLVAAAAGAAGAAEVVAAAVIATLPPKALAITLLKSVLVSAASVAGTAAAAPLALGVRVARALVRVCAEGPAVFCAVPPAWTGVSLPLSWAAVVGAPLCEPGTVSGV